ncbi:hypothetical protein ATL41_2365 [Flavimobilis soli]|jgi:DNA-directed RNA polymerase subunit M/transcription elongation factor TFIIS|uniref:Uncharacterized protein n=1 Tax=Flavimobilis soli TaxID=442709 RepID=A0A2A9EFA1_9MICO|nr:hypothetical protein ATL41_2365 [Flavimobilis soli]
MARGTPERRPATSGPATPASAARGRRRSTRTPDATPLGSLSQAAPVPAGTKGCTSCGSRDLTRVSLRLTDGTEVVFVSCHDCESRGWVDTEGDPVPDEFVHARSGRKS